MGPQQVFALVSTLLIVGIALLIPLLLKRSRRRRRRRAREAWRDFAGKHDFEFTEPDDSRLFQMRGQYDGELVDFRVRHDSFREEGDFLSTLLCTDIEQAPADLVVYPTDASDRQWKSVGEKVDVGGLGDRDDLEVRTSDIARANEFLKRPGVGEALLEAHRGGEGLLLESGQIRFRHDGYLDDPDRLREYADLLATTRRAIRQAPEASADASTAGSSEDDSEPVATW